MADLRGLCQELGFRRVRTVLQSGNIVFETDASDFALVGGRLKAGIRERFGFEAHVLLRAADGFKATLARHPFTAEQLERGNHAMLVFLADAPDLAAVEALRKTNPGRETIHAAGDALYIFYTDGAAGSKLDNRRIERTLKTVSSARNWQSCQRILKLLDGVDA